MTSDRNERLAKALRDNLRRRKSWQRQNRNADAEKAANPSSEPAGEVDAQSDTPESPRPKEE